MIEHPGFLLTLVAFLLMIGPLVFVHELGHYLAGQWFGVKAEVFSIGFGPELFGFVDRRGTRWKVSALPLGGYVRFAGDMNPASQPDAAWLELPPEERNRTFPSKAVWQRAIIVAAGPAVNFLAALLILAGFAMAYGNITTPAVVQAVTPGSAAAAAGLRPNDRITAIGGRSVADFNDLVRYVTLHAGMPVEIVIQRRGAAETHRTIIGTATETDRFGNRSQIGRLGVASPMPVIVPVGLLQAPVVAVRQTGQILSTMTEALGQIVSGRRSVRELGGPIGTAKVAGERLSLGAQPFIFLIALVSINLGFINLLPVPMLDGGHLLFYAIEAARRKPVTPDVQEWAFRGGLAALLALMLLVTFNDLGAFGLWRGLAGLIG